MGLVVRETQIVWVQLLAHHSEDDDKKMKKSVIEAN